MPSQTQVINIALGRLGQSRVTDINEAGSAAAEAVRDNWDLARDAALRAHAWGFALKRAALTADVVNPLMGWERQYELPSDFRRLIRMNGYLPGVDAPPMTIEGNMLLTNCTTAEIIYVRNVEAPEEWDATFTEAFTFKLAAAVATRLKGDSGETTRLLMEAEFVKMLKAMEITNTEQAPRVRPVWAHSMYLAARMSDWEGEYPPYWMLPAPPVEYGVPPGNPYNVFP